MSLLVLRRRGRTRRYLLPALRRCPWRARAHPSCRALPVNSPIAAVPSLDRRSFDLQVSILVTPEVRVKRHRASKWSHPVSGSSDRAARRRPRAGTTTGPVTVAGSRRTPMPAGAATAPAPTSGGTASALFAATSAGLLTQREPDIDGGQGDPIAGHPRPARAESPAQPVTTRLERIRAPVEGIAARRAAHRRRSRRPTHPHPRRSRQWASVRGRPARTDQLIGNGSVPRRRREGPATELGAPPGGPRHTPRCPPRPSRSVAEFPVSTGPSPMSRLGERAPGGDRRPARSSARPPTTRRPAPCGRSSGPNGRDHRSGGRAVTPRRPARRPGPPPR